MNEQEWMEIGNQAKKIRTELFKLQRMASGKMPVAIVHHIKNAIDDVDRFRNAAEERMLKSGESQNLTVFYGPNPEKTSKGEIDSSS